MRREYRHFFTVVRLHKLHFPQPGRRTSSQQPIRAEDKAERQERDCYLA
jgi:hypothetical protein